MKKKYLPLITALAALPFLTQCASQQDVNSMRYQLRVVNNKLEELKSGTVEEMRRRQASSLSKFDELEQEMLVMKGQINELAHFNRQLKEQNKELDLTFQQYTSTVQEKIKQEREKFETIEKQKDTKLTTLERKLLRQQQILKKIQEARLREAKRKAEEAARAAEQARVRAKSSASTLSRSSGDILLIEPRKEKIIKGSGSANTTSVENQPAASVNTQQEKAPAKPQTSSTGDLFASAEQAYANGDYKRAYSIFEEFSTSGGDEDKVITAKFMMGECLFQQNELDQAILMYQNIISRHPRHPKAASALLKQGMAFEKLSDPDTAKIIYKKIMSSYSSSPEADKARKRSQNL